MQNRNTEKNRSNPKALKTDTSSYKGIQMKCKKRQKAYRFKIMKQTR